MKKLLAVASATLMLTSVAGVSAAHHRDDHTQNYRGMCTAYFSGSETGQENKRKNGNAFIVFAENVGDYNEDGERNAQDVADFCMDEVGSYGNPGQGNEPYFPGDDE